MAEQQPAGNPELLADATAFAIKLTDATNHLTAIVVSLQARYPREAGRVLAALQTLNDAIESMNRRMDADGLLAGYIEVHGDETH